MEQMGQRQQKRNCQKVNQSSWNLNTLRMVSCPRKTPRMMYKRKARARPKPERYPWMVPNTKVHLLSQGWESNLMQRLIRAVAKFWWWMDLPKTHEVLQNYRAKDFKMGSHRRVKAFHPVVQNRYQRRKKREKRKTRSARREISQAHPLNHYQALGIQKRTRRKDLR